jgi:hypothetical protein
MLSAHVVRSALLCFTSLIPQNGSITEVAFTTSMQIVVSLVYVLFYATIIVMHRILCSRDAATEPAENDGDELTEATLDEHINRTTRVRQRAWDRMREARSKLRQQVRRMTAQLLLNKPITESNSLTTGTDMRLNASLPDIFSDDSEEDSVHDSAHGRAAAPAKGSTNHRKKCVVGTMHGRKVYSLDESTAAEHGAEEVSSVATHNTSAAQTTDVNSVVTRATELYAKERDRYAGSLQASVMPSHRGALYSASPYEADDLETAQREHAPTFNVYTEVYALGFAVFVFSYSIDSTNMQAGCTLLLGLAVLALLDLLRVLDPLLQDNTSSNTQLLRAMCVTAFMLMLAAQICAFVGIARVPSYHAASRDGFAMHIPAPATLLDSMLAIVFPLLAPIMLYPICKRDNVHRLQPMLRAALPTTVFVAAWFLSLFATMDAELRETFGVDASLDASVERVLAGDRVELPVVLLAPLLKIPAVLALISCCIAGKSIDVLTALGLVFYVKQKGIVKESAMQDMLVISTIFASCAWTLTTLRYCTPITRCLSRKFDMVEQ